MPSSWKLFCKFGKPTAFLLYVFNVSSNQNHGKRNQHANDKNSVSQQCGPEGDRKGRKRWKTPCCRIYSDYFHHGSFNATHLYSLQFFIYASFKFLLSHLNLSSSRLIRNLMQMIGLGFGDYFYRYVYF